MNKEDLTADIEMSFKQIMSLTDLMLECNYSDMPTILAIRDIAQSGFENLNNNLRKSRVL